MNQLLPDPPGHGMHRMPLGGNAVKHRLVPCPKDASARVPALLRFIRRPFAGECHPVAEMRLDEEPSQAGPLGQPR